jgi:hypothetical protein
MSTLVTAIFFVNTTAENEMGYGGVAMCNCIIYTNEMLKQ